MGDILELIKSRRNIKTFLPKFVSWENIAKIIDAARHAPCSGNIQNWRFVVALDSNLKQALAQASYEQYEIAQAGVLIVVCSEDDKVERYYGMRGVHLYSIQNCAAAIENMLLEAHSLGLGTRWIGGFDEDAVKTMLRIPPEVRPQAIIAVGYPRDIPQRPAKFPLESLIYFNAWRNRHRDPAKYMQDTATTLQRRADEAKEAWQKAKQKVTQTITEAVGKKNKKKALPPLAEKEQEEPYDDDFESRLF